MKNDFYFELYEVIGKFENHVLLIVQGDFSVKSGCDNNGHKRATGKHWLGVTNDNGEKLVGLWNVNVLRIEGIILQLFKV